LFVLAPLIAGLFNVIYFYFYLIQINNNFGAMAMERFDILGALETAALAKGYKFVYGFNKFYNNEELTQQFNPGGIVLIADYKATPTYSGVKYSNIKYTCLLMLGRKFDANGQAAGLDENFEQKYGRRIKDLVAFLSNFIGEFACTNKLTVTDPTISPSINQFDENLDFAIANNVIFDQK